MPLRQPGKVAAIKPLEDTVSIRMRPLISIIVPVWQEAEIIQALIDHLQSLAMASRAEIIVVDGSANGETIERLSACKNVAVLCAPRGRAAQMNAGAQQATGNILLFLHADTRLPPQALSAIASATQRSSVRAGAFKLGIAGTRRGYRLIEKSVYWRSRLIQLVYGDQAIFIRRRLFARLQGYDDLALMEDVALVRKLKRNGHGIAQIPLPVQTSARRWQREGLVRCTLRNWMLLGLYLFGANPSVLARWYR